MSDVNLGIVCRRPEDELHEKWYNHIAIIWRANEKRENYREVAKEPFKRIFGYEFGVDHPWADSNRLRFSDFYVDVDSQWNVVGRTYDGYAFVGMVVSYVVYDNTEESK